MTDNSSPLARLDCILLASDGSEHSAGAIRVAIALAQRSGAQLMSMTMVRIGEHDELVRKASEDALAHLEGVAAEAAPLGVQSTPLVCLGDEPWREICEQAELNGADLIVMGRRGSRGLARMGIGDATAKVIGHAEVSVLVAPRAGRIWGSRILLGTDGSRGSDAAARAAIEIARRCPAPITVLSALVPSHSDKRHQEGRDAAERTAEMMRRAGLDAEAVAVPGEADQAIVDTARDKGADLIVLGSHGRTGFGKVLMGSVSERVVTRAECPVLVVRA